MGVVDHVLDRFRAVNPDNEHSEILTIQRPGGDLFLPCGDYYHDDDGAPHFEVYDCERNLSGHGRTQIQCSRWTGR